MADVIEMNAMIESVSMRMDRDVFLSGWVLLKRADGFHQGLGGFILGGDPSVKAGQHNEQRNLAAEWLVGIMRAADVDDYAKAVGKVVRIRVGKAFSSDIEAIGHALKDDRWFSPKQAFSAMTRAGDEP